MVNTPVDEETDAEDVEDLDEDLELDDEGLDDALVEDDLVEDDLVEDDDVDDEDVDVEDSANDGEEETEALEELEAEELELLEEEAATELLVDEAAELRAIRREELSLSKGPEDRRSDEFVCSSCFMVKRTSQLANKRKKLCNDCAA